MAERPGARNRSAMTFQTETGRAEPSRPVTAPVFTPR
jgi:hypothetical protein